MTEFDEDIDEEPECDCEDDEEGEQNFISNIEWIKQRKDYLKILAKDKTLKDCDRLEMSRIFIDTHGMLAESVSGYENYFKAPHALALINETETKEFVSQYIEAVERYIQLDIKFTEIIEKSRIKKLKEIVIPIQHRTSEYSV